MPCLEKGFSMLKKDLLELDGFQEKKATKILDELKSGFNRMHLNDLMKLLVNNIFLPSLIYFAFDINILNYTLNKSDINTNVSRTQAPKNIIAVPAGVEQYGKIHTPQYNDQCQGCRQIDPDILNAFKQNPYTFSLSS